MSIQSQISEQRPMAGLSPRLLLVLLVAIAAGVALLWNYDRFVEYLSAFNGRRGVVYPSAFTFLSILWAASLTIWGLLKSRATRYVERLHDNVVFMRFVSHMEWRIVYAFLVIVASFIIYISDLSFGKTLDSGAVLIVLWVYAYVVSVWLIFDSLLTARIVLD